MGGGKKFMILLWKIKQNQGKSKGLKRNESKSSISSSTLHFSLPLRKQTRIEEQVKILFSMPLRKQTRKGSEMKATFHIAIKQIDSKWK